MGALADLQAFPSAARFGREIVAAGEETQVTELNEGQIVEVEVERKLAAEVELSMIDPIAFAEHDGIVVEEDTDAPEARNPEEELRH